MILKYQKVFVTHDERHSTTITLSEPDYQDGHLHCTELCTIGNDTYVHVPDLVVLPEQPSELEVTMESVTLTNELKAEIKALSPHIKLANYRLKERINFRDNFDYDEFINSISIEKLLDPAELIKVANAGKAKVAQDNLVNTFKLNTAKRTLGLTVEEAPVEDLAAYVATLEADITNPSSDVAYHPPLPPGVTPPAVAAISATITREPGWNNVLGWRIALDISDPAYIPANIAISVYSSANCVGYLYTPGALQLNSTTGKYFAVCPPGQEKGDVAYHFGLLYGAAQLSCWTVAAGEQTKTIQIFGD